MGHGDGFTLDSWGLDHKMVWNITHGSKTNNRDNVITCNEYAMHEKMNDVITHPFSSVVFAR